MSMSTFERLGDVQGWTKFALGMNADSDDETLAGAECEVISLQALN